MVKMHLVMPMYTPLTTIYIDDHYLHNVIVSTYSMVPLSMLLTVSSTVSGPIFRVESISGHGFGLSLAQEARF